jgi:hypothetical protein
MFRRIAFITSIVATAVSCFTLGVMQARHTAWAGASYDARFDAFRVELREALARNAKAMPVATMGGAIQTPEQLAESANGARAEMVSQIKEQLRNEMGLLPVSLLRERSSSFVELYSYDSDGQRTYGTAGYLGGGYFVTVKHAVIALQSGGATASRKINQLRVMYQGKEIPATVVDSGDAEVEVDSGDWAIIKTKELDLPPLRVDTAFPYEFADPIFRLGNDYSKGIVVSTGYVGQRTEGGLVTCLTDGHPGVSGGGVLDKRGALVGIPIGRMQGDYRFSFILPMRAEILRKVPVFVPADAISVVAANH